MGGGGRAGGGISRRVKFVMDVCTRPGLDVCVCVWGGGGVMVLMPNISSQTHRAGCKQRLRGRFVVLIW